ncbi:hypothetical protein GP486_008815, partial [Trichoglossum hirsutum]
MDVASSVNIEPPHTLSPVFGPHPSHPQPRLSSPIPSQHPQSPTAHPASPPPPAAEMDLSSSATATAALLPPAEVQHQQQQQDDHQDARMENAESSQAESLPNGHVPFPAASEALTDGSLHPDGEAMDTTPDHSQEPAPANGVPAAASLTTAMATTTTTTAAAAANSESATQQLDLITPPNFTSTSAHLPDIIPNGDAETDAGEPMDTT